MSSTMAYGALRLEEDDQIGTQRVGGRGDADEGDAGGTGGAGIVDGVADVKDGTGGTVVQDAQEPVGGGLVVLDVVHADDGIEDQVRRRSDRG